MQKRDFDYGTRFIAYVEKGDGSCVHYKSLGTFDTAVAAALARATAQRAPAAELAPPPAAEAARAAESGGADRGDVGPPAPAPPVLAAVPAGETLSAKVDRIKTKLGELAPHLSIMAAIREANALMELTPDGLSLPKQADRLLAVLG